MPGWTNVELRRLREAHARDYPSMAELAAMFPRHTPRAVVTRASELGLRDRYRDARHWLRIAHTHFARREAENRQWRAAA
jgi:hypothetical protein